MWFVGLGASCVVRCCSIIFVAFVFVVTIFTGMPMSSSMPMHPTTMRSIDARVGLVAVAVIIVTTCFVLERFDLLFEVIRFHFEFANFFHLFLNNVLEIVD